MRQQQGNYREDAIGYHSICKIKNQMMNVWGYRLTQEVLHVLKGFIFTNAFSFKDKSEYLATHSIRFIIHRTIHFFVGMAADNNYLRGAVHTV